MIEIYHVINPYTASEGSESEAIQQKTFHSLRLAKDYARDVVNVCHVLRVDPQDEAKFRKSPPIPDSAVEPLERFSSDIGSFQVPRRLPLLSDVFSSNYLVGKAGRELSDKGGKGAYLIFTNMDICVTPFFYTECARLISVGHECFVINRRTVPKEYLDRPLLDGFFAGSEPHPGHDCFVMPLSVLPQFVLTNSIIGIGYVFRPLLLNCILNFGGSFKEFGDAYLTLHYGDDMDWKGEQFADYLEHNKNELRILWIRFAERIRNSDSETMDLLKSFFSFGFLPRIAQ